MQAALLYDAHDFRIEELPRPEIKEDEVLIKVKACGVCHSEIHQWDEKIKGLDYPRFIGHEASGIVIKTGSKVDEFKAGDRVALWVDGKGYAEELAVKADRVFHLADNISFEEALAEPIACTTNGVLKAHLQFNDTVALVGTGFMGLILLQQIKLTNPKHLIAIDIRDEMLKLAKELGADIVINPKKQDVKKEIEKITNKKGVDVCFEVGGMQGTLDIAPEITRMEGKIVIFGYHPGQRIIKDLGWWNWMAFDIVNAHFRNINTIIEGSRIGVELLNQGKINMKPLITHTFPLKKIEKAFKAAKDKPKGFIKSAIVFD